MVSCRKPLKGCKLARRRRRRHVQRLKFTDRAHSSAAVRLARERLHSCPGRQHKLRRTCTPQSCCCSNVHDARAACGSQSQQQVVVQQRLDSFCFSIYPRRICAACNTFTPHATCKHTQTRSHSFARGRGSAEHTTAARATINRSANKHWRARSRCSCPSGGIVLCVVFVCAAGTTYSGRAPHNYDDLGCVLLCTRRPFSPTRSAWARAGRNYDGARERIASCGGDAQHNAQRSGYVISTRTLYDY